MRLFHDDSQISLGIGQGTEGRWHMLDYISSFIYNGLMELDRSCVVDGGDLEVEVLEGID